MSQSLSYDNTEITKLATGAGVTLLGRFAGRIIQLLGQIAVAHLLGPEAFGLYGISLAILTMVGFVSPLGLDYGVIHYGSRRWGTDPAGLRSVLFWSLGLAFLSGLLIGISLYVIAPWLADQVFQKPQLMYLIRWSSPAFALAAGLRVAAAATRISQQMQYSVYVQDLAQPTLNFSLIILFYLIGWGLFGAIIANVISFIVAFLLALFYIKSLFTGTFHRCRAPMFSVRELVLFSLPTTMEAITYNFTFRVVDRLLVGYFRSANEVGVYQAASQLAVSFAVVIGSFSSIFSPMIADLGRRGEMKKLQELFRVSTKWGIYLCLPVFVLVWTSSQEIMVAIYGTQYENGALLLIILTTAQLINVGTGAVGPLLIMTGHRNRWFVISVAMLCISVVLNYLLIPKLGLMGAALGSTCGTGGLSVLGLCQVRYSLGIWPYDRGYVKGILAALLASCVLLFLRMVQVGGTGAGLLSMLVVSSGIFGATLIALGLDAEDRELIHLIRARLWASKTRLSKLVTGNL